MTVGKIDLNEEDYEIEFLEHYGVKGMKWGVRRTQAQLDRAAGRPVRKSSSSGSSNTKKKKSSGGSGGSSSSKKSSSSSGSSESKKKRPNAAQRAGKAVGERIKKRRETRNKNKALAKLASRPVSDLTTQELRDITQRLQLERQYAQLTATEKKGAKAAFDKVLSGAKVLNEVASTGTNLYNNGKKIMAITQELNKRK